MLPVWCVGVPRVVGGLGMVGVWDAVAELPLRPSAAWAVIVILGVACVFGDFFLVHRARLASGLAVIFTPIFPKHATCVE